MRRFARLVTILDDTAKTSVRVTAMAEYFAHTNASDAAWALWFLSGHRPKRIIPIRRLAAWAMEVADVPAWMFDECYAAVGDLAETVSLLLAASEAPLDVPLHEWIEARILPVAKSTESEQRIAMTRAWLELDGMERFVFNKLVTGELRMGVSQSLVVRALSQATGIPGTILAHRLNGPWTPSRESFDRLRAADDGDAVVSQPYPFFLAHALDEQLESLGDATDWQVEWMWDGVRVQVIHRGGQVFIWSRTEELLTSRFPELVEAAETLPDGTVIDGEIMAWQHDSALPFSRLQRRIGRQQLTPQVLADVPVALVVYDLLEVGGADIREHPLLSRRERLERLVAALPAPATAAIDVHGDLFDPDRDAVAREQRLIVSPVLPVENWDDVRGAYARARETGVVGLMLKRRESTYGVDRRRGAWWKWKTAPHRIDAVMLYAQPGHGRRASLHTEYTFAVWDGDELIPFAKATSGLTDDDIQKLDAWIRRNTLEKFGPVRAVKAEQVFELGFDGIQASTRHKSGVTVRLPRILRWRRDKNASDAGTLAALKALIE